MSSVGFQLKKIVIVFEMKVILYSAMIFYEIELLLFHKQVFQASAINSNFERHF